MVTMSNTAASADQLTRESIECALGQDGWLFTQQSVDWLASGRPVEASVVEAWQRELAQRSAALAQRDIRYIHLGVPDKLSVMSEHWPAQIEQVPYSVSEPGFAGWSADQLKKLNCLLDPSDYLIRQKGKYPLYWKTDTRWTPWSSYMAYQLLCGQLKVQTNNQLLGYPFNEVEQPMILNQGVASASAEMIRTYRLRLRSRRRYANELALYRETLTEDQALLSQTRFSEGTQVVFENRHDEASDRCIVLFGDAHSAETRTLLTGMLAETFAEVHFIWGDAIDLGYIDQVRPDVVITQCSEWQMTLPPACEFHLHEKAGDTLLALQQCSLDLSDASTKALSMSTSGSTTVNRSTADTPADIRVANLEDGVRLLLQSERYSLDPPGMVQEHGHCENPETQMVSNEVSLTQISSASVFFTGASWWVHDGKAREVLRHEIPIHQKPARRWRPRKRLSGLTLMLATSAGAHCYYHWMLEILPKLGMLEREGISLDSIDHFMVREITANWQRETLARFGIDASQIVETARQPHWRCDRLLHIDLTCGINLKMHRFIPQWMKHLYAPAAPDEPRLKLYITRPQGVRRGIRNESQILPLLRDAGFTIMPMEGLSVAEQARLLSRADVLMSPHGGALTNMVFCRPGITVIELFSRHVFPYYYGLAANCGHRYHAILENPQEDYARLVNIDRAQGFADTQHETAGLSFDVDVEAVTRVLGTL